MNRVQWNMQNKLFTVLALGDVVGSAGLEAVSKHLPELKRNIQPDITVINAENCADSNGTDLKGAAALLNAGADVLTGGNHTVRMHELFDALDENDVILRPLNLPPLCPGKGHAVLTARSGIRVLVISAIGQTFMPPCENPFLATDRLLKEKAGTFDLAVCDLHAEATSEKAAYAEYFDGRINVVFGTHTHVQTSDKRFFPKGTGFVTDIGMCGVTDSILGVKSDAVIKQFTVGVHDRFERAKGNAVLHGAVFEINHETKRVVNIRHLEI